MTTEASDDDRAGAAGDGAGGVVGAAAAAADVTQDEINGLARGVLAELVALKAAWLSTRANEEGAAA